MLRPPAPRFVAAVLEELTNGTLALPDGSRLPRLGFGTASMRTAHVATALRAGLRMLDTAVMYANEAAVAAAVQQVAVPRSELRIVTKAWPYAPAVGRSRDFDSPHVLSAEQLIEQVEAHIEKLGCGHVDLLLLHWPTHALRTHWAALLTLRSRGLTRSVGLSNSSPRHLNLLRHLPNTDMPSVLQTELAPVKADARIDVEIEPLAQYCAQHNIALMSHSPIKAALKDGNAKLLAAESNVTIPQLVLRYGLQRGFAMIFSSRSAAHIASNLRVFDFEIPAEQMAEMACWRREVHCGNLSASIGVQRPRRRLGRGKEVLRHFLAPSAWVSPPPQDAIVPVLPGEPDPVTLEAGQSKAERFVAELRAAPQLAVMPPGFAAPIGSIEAYATPDHVRTSRLTSTDRCGGKRCEFSLEVTRPSGARYAELVRNVSQGLAETLADPHDSHRRMDAAKGASAQHVISVKPGRGWRLAPALGQLLEEFIKPVLAERIFQSSPIVLKQATASRNANDFPPEHFGRRRSMLWHYDGLGEGNVKVILYLNDVDHHHGCMVAMRHNSSGKAFVVKPSAVRLGGEDALPVLPALWLSDLASKGYEPVCLKGAAGTLVIFDVNIVHRGSRPTAGLHRDFVLLEMCTPGLLNHKGRWPSKRCLQLRDGALPGLI